MQDCPICGDECTGFPPVDHTLVEEWGDDYVDPKTIKKRERTVLATRDIYDDGKLKYRRGSRIPVAEARRLHVLPVESDAAPPIESK